MHGICILLNYYQPKLASEQYHLYTQSYPYLMVSRASAILQIPALGRWAGGGNRSESEGLSGVPESLGLTHSPAIGQLCHLGSCLI